MKLCPMGHELAAPLGAPVELLDNYCPLCAICTTCGRALTPKEYQWAIEPRSSGVMIHPTCAALAIPRDGMVTISQATLDTLNQCRLLIEPLLDRSEITNAYHAECQLNASPFVHQMSKDEQYLFVVRLESIAAGMRLALSKNFENIRIEHAKRDKVKYSAALAVRDEPTKRERVILSKRDKAIKGFTDLGMPYDAAAAKIDGEYIKQGIIKPRL